jgi:hypothetical protein
MDLNGIRQAVIRALTALLLLTAFATPALAEIACAGDTIVHLEDRAVSSGDLDVSAQSDPTDRETGGQTEHCAFSHGHCFGIASAAARSERVLPSIASYDGMAAPPLAAHNLDAPERPPAA